MAISGARAPEWLAPLFADARKFSQLVDELKNMVHADSTGDSEVSGA
jgi:hypothetical protein